MLVMEPGRNVSHAEQGALLALGRFQEAIEAERRSRLRAGGTAAKLDQELGQLKRAFDAEGPAAYWRRELKGATKWHNTYWQAQAWAQLGRNEEALKCLTECLNKRDPDMTFSIMADWTLDPVRSEPGFHEILRRMGLE